MTQQLEQEYAEADFEMSMAGGSLHGEQQFMMAQEKAALNRAARNGSFAPSMHPPSTLGNQSMASMPSAQSFASFGNLSANNQAQLNKYESISSSAVRAADKVGASLILVFTSSGRTAQLVAKYRPPMPIVTLVIPQLVSDGMK